MKTRRIVVAGTLACDPWAGMAWMEMQIAAGLLRLGHDVYYIETTSCWPYDPIRRYKVADANYTLPYLERVAASFGLQGRWAYRTSYSDGQWHGMEAAKAEQLLAHADIVLNPAGACRPRTVDGLRVGHQVYLGTDPGYDEIRFLNDAAYRRGIEEEFDDFATYGENLGLPGCAIPPLPGLRARTRQPVLVDVWECGPPSRCEFTTVCNWRQDGHDIEFQGETYTWSKHHEFLKVIDLPRRTTQKLELAMGMVNVGEVIPGKDEMIPALGMTVEERRALDENDWSLTDAHKFTTDPWRYRDYIQASRGEFTVAKDQYARLQGGWFSERSACYLAAGRPVVTQDTGFGKVLPVGEGLFAFQTAEEAAAALEEIGGDYARHSRAARRIAEEYFRAEKVLAKLLVDLGL